MTAVVSTEALVAEAESRAGTGAVHSATDADAVDGVRPRLVVQPRSADQLAATLAWASSERLHVLVRGGGTKLAWGAPASAFDLILSTAGLASRVEHRHGDLTATVDAGVTLAAANRALGAHGQWLPLDPSEGERATIGGIVATNDSGPRRHRHGAPRDLIIGITVARSDGEIAKAGGIVVKNVAGYDLSRLYTGSFGSLGVILTATFKLVPVASASRTVVVEPEGQSTTNALEALEPLVADVMASSLTPSALEAGWPPARLLVRFESVEEAVTEQAAEVTRLVGNRGRATVVARDAESTLWRRHAGLRDQPGSLVKLTTLPTACMPTLAWLRDQGAAHDLSLAVAGRAGLGVVDVRLDGGFDAQARVVAALRERVPIGQGSAVIRRAQPELRQRVDPWGPVGDGLRVMQSVKRRLDPSGTLNPGRGPGGL